MTSPRMAGILGAVERRAARTPDVLNEFNREPAVTFTAVQQLVPLSVDLGVRVRLHVHIATEYVLFPEDKGDAMVAAERRATHELCRFAYADVLEALFPVQRAIGEGRRRDALTLVSVLINRLHGSEE